MAKQIIINGRMSTFNTTDWVDSETGAAFVDGVDKRNRKKDSFLDECAGYTNDDYWQEILINMSNGDYPDRLTYYNGTLIVDSHKLAVNIDPEIACDEIIGFLKTYLGLHSPDEQIDESDAEEVKDNSGEMWSTMLKKHKEQAVIRFMVNEQRKRGLSPVECERLHCILNFGFTLKYFHKDNVVVNNYTIVAITGLSFDPVTRTYSIDKSQRKKESRSTSRSNVKPKKNYNNTWEFICNKVIENGLEVSGQDESILDEDDECYSRSSN
jgi:hypothetical protein